MAASLVTTDGTDLLLGAGGDLLYSPSGDPTECCCEGCCDDPPTYVCVIFYLVSDPDTFYTFPLVRDDTGIPGECDQQWLLDETSDCLPDCVDEVILRCCDGNYYLYINGDEYALPEVNCASFYVEAGEPYYQPSSDEDCFLSTEEYEVVLTQGNCDQCCWEDGFHGDLETTIDIGTGTHTLCNDPATTLLLAAEDECGHRTWATIAEEALDDCMTLMQFSHAMKCVNGVWTYTLGVACEFGGPYTYETFTGTLISCDPFSVEFPMSIDTDCWSTDDGTITVTVP